jgi:O-acetylhomoserine/O-acetylserine sulfhydrylase-like pyridoxal-dependent enzyme
MNGCTAPDSVETVVIEIEMLHVRLHSFKSSLLDVLNHLRRHINTNSVQFVLLEVRNIMARTASSIKNSIARLELFDKPVSYVQKLLGKN